MSVLETFKEILATPSDQQTVRELRQPERHVLLIFKAFKYLMERCGQLEERIAGLERQKSIAGWAPNNTQPSPSREINTKAGDNKPCGQS